MKKLLSLGLFLISINAHAAQIIPASYNALPGVTVNNTVAFADGIFPSERGQWQTNTAWWKGTTPGLSMDLGAVYRIDDVLLSVDNNDFYTVQWSTDNTSWTNLFSIDRSYGEVTWGMDTMSSQAGHAEYIPGIDFPVVFAQFFKVFATHGDNSYSIGEFQVFGSPVSEVPVPAATFLFAPALLGFMGLRRKAKQA